MMSFGFIHIVACIKTSFIFMAELCSSVAECLSCFHLLATVNSAAVNTHTYKCLYKYVFMPLGQIPRSGMTKSHGSLVHVHLISEELPDGFPQ